jgi:hypothetical protein
MEHGQQVVFRKGDEAMVVNCEQVWLEVSNYLDGEVDPALRVAIDEHVRGCKHCAAVVDGTRNVIELYGDERMLEVPLGFSHRLQQRISHQQLSETMPSSRRGFLGWMAAAAAAVLIAGGVEVVRFTSSMPELGSEIAKAGNGVPPKMMVIVSEDGKLFHAARCPFIRERTKLRSIPAEEATLEGYTPCIHCLKKYLEAT